MSAAESVPQANRLSSGFASDTLLVLAGQASFVLCGYLLHFFLSRRLDPAAFGSYGVILSVLTWSESVLETGVPWAVRKFLSADPGASESIIAAGLRWQLALAVPLWAIATLAAPILTGAIRDPGLAALLRLALVDIVWMALYTLYRAVLNGRRQFALQGASMTAYAVSKLASSILLVLLGYAVAGALVGNILGSFLGWLATSWLVRRGARSLVANQAAGREHAYRYSGLGILRFALPTVVFTLASTFLTSIGLVVVKALVGDGAQVGHYAAAAYLANAPNLLLVAFSWTLFPHLAACIGTGDYASASNYLRVALRYLSLVLIPGTSLVLGTSSRLITIIYPSSYAVAAPLLNSLMLSTALYSVFIVFANAILAEGRVLLAVGIPGTLVPVALTASWLFTRECGAAGAAYAAVLATLLAAFASGAYVLKRFRVQLEWASLARASVSAAVLYALSHFVPAGGLWLVACYLALGAVYLALLCLLGEFSRQDLQGAWARLAAALHRQ